MAHLHIRCTICLFQSICSHNGMVSAPFHEHILSAGIGNTVLTVDLCIANPSRVDPATTAGLLCLWGTRYAVVFTPRRPAPWIKSVRAPCYFSVPRVPLYDCLTGYLMQPCEVRWGHGKFSARYWQQWVVSFKERDLASRRSLIALLDSTLPPGLSRLWSYYLSGLL